MAATRSLARCGSGAARVAGRRELQVAATESLSPRAHTATPLRPLSEMGGPPAWPLVGNFVQYVKKGNRGRLHEVLASQHDQYGTVFREKLGPRTHVHVSDPALFEKVLRQEGRFPKRNAFLSWILYRKVTGEALGPVTSEGPEWHRLRSTLSKRLLRPKMVQQFEDDINAVVTDLVAKLRHERDQGDGKTINRLPNELYKWAMESIGTVVFETRMGCLKNPVPPTVQEFINAMDLMMKSSLQIIIGEELHQKLNTRFWRRHKHAWDTLFKTTTLFVDNRLEAVKQQLESESEDIHGAFLSYFLATSQLSRRELNASVVEILLGGVDTTSNTMSFTLHMLANHQNVQEKVHAEISREVGDRIPTAQDLQRLPYLKNVVKETLRLYPTIPMNVRMLNTDIDLAGYRIPKETLIVMNHHAACRSPAVFDNPTEFLPERWDKSEKDAIHKFASLPFGYGPKSCLGRRIAEMEIHLALARISQQFHLAPTDRLPFKPFLRTLLSPGEQLPIEFNDR